ncbi:hypothetical protein L1F28_24790 [Arthrospira platensis NCB002]|uniref:hypothetical protein n=1 Tax=Limnospira platensis TaxID=118562 RepID=UPI0001D0E5CF|nr:hypothetical protein [Arthrospira platensis NCB002]BAI92618.1 hypothetical protein NIES39_L04610 [Arthrospira platensis NIES-39]
MHEFLRKKRSPQIRLLTKTTFCEYTLNYPRLGCVKLFRIRGGLTGNFKIFPEIFLQLW